MEERKINIRGVDTGPQDVQCVLREVQVDKWEALYPK